MSLFETLSEMIDLRSFSNLWYWIALAVLWSTLSHRILGVPFDMVARARKYGGQPAQDLEDLVRINVNRMMFVVHSAGVWLLGLACFVLSVLATLGFALNVETAQAVFLLVFPLSLVVLINLKTAQKVIHQEARGEELYKAMTTCRLLIQLLGMLCIFVTALWGMFQNLNIGPLGG
ncbi:MAG: component of SufBCD complex [Roseobacter sp. MedPE-SW]|nr:MAG: component of SufBCD complex [Roseobacter sp. MedPE-SW]